MSLSRLPQVALRRLMPAISVAPKSLDDDQLKKILDPQQHATATILAKGSLPHKSELAGLSTHSGSSSLISALAKSAATTSSQSTGISPALGRLLMNLTGTHGMLSSQDLALLKAANSDTAASSLLTTPEPGSPAPEHLLGLEYQEPTIGALDSASVDALVSALRGTAAISSSAAINITPSVAELVAYDDAFAGTPLATESPTALTATYPSTAVVGGAKGKRAASPAATSPTVTAALEEHNEIACSLAKSEDMEFDQSDDDLSPISADLSAAERRKEQNRRAQKKFRQKDKVRQKEVKWRASQYEDLVESNKRFKRDIDSISRERDMYRRILEQNGINLDGHVKISATTGSSGPSLLSSTSRSPSMASSTSVVSSDAAVTSPALLSIASVPLGMDQIAQDTFGSTAASAISLTSPSMNDLLSSLMYGGVVKSDPMFGSTGTNIWRRGALTSTATTISNPPPPPSLLFDLPATDSSLFAEANPGMIDHHVVDAPFAQHGIIDSPLVDPMSFIDELLASPSGFTPMSSSSVHSSGAVSRKRSFDDTMF